MEKGIDISSRFNITDGPKMADLSVLLDLLCGGGIPPKKSVFHVRADVSNEPDRVFKKPIVPFRMSNAIPLRITHMHSEQAVMNGVVSQSLYQFEGNVMDDVLIAHIQLTKNSVLKGVYDAFTHTGYIDIVSV